MRRVYAVTYLSSANGSWPIDMGDDPSFLASSNFRSDGGVLTWGVCRQDVRNNLKPGDLVIFFACDRLANRRPAWYFFIGFATVDKTVSQVDIWEKPELKTYRRYRNLLIRPLGDGFEHFEPQTDRANWHRDWLWRISDTKGWKKRDLVSLDDGSEVHFGRSYDGKILNPGANYVIFTPEGSDTHIIAAPPVVAEVESTGKTEKWGTDPVSSDVWHEVLEGTPRQCLRTRNRQQPHRHIVVPNVNTDEWLERLSTLCERHGLRSR